MAGAGTVSEVGFVPDDLDAELSRSGTCPGEAAETADSGETAETANGPELAVAISSTAGN